MHLAVEQGQKPLSVVITVGRRGGSPQFAPALEAIRVPRLGLGRPRKRPNRVRADKAYDFRKNRAYLGRRGIKATIPLRRTGSATGAGLAPSAAGRRSSFRVRQQPAQAPPRCRNQVRQACRPLRSDCADRSPQRMAVTASPPCPHAVRELGSGHQPASRPLVCGHWAQQPSRPPHPETPPCPSLVPAPSSPRPHSQPR
ncbi:hypothetical protein [Streptomyces sp. NPDC054987]